MIIIAKVLSVVVDGILQLKLDLPVEVLQQASTVEGQTRVGQLHMTLIRLDDLQATVAPTDLPAPPAKVELDRQLLLVDSGVKRSCYLAATASMQQSLRTYAVQCAEALGLNPDIAVDLKRVFHVTVSNAGEGLVRASVGAPWEFAAQAI